ncbi:MAG: hypothetical protein INQ03_18585 [Candidatus Heimdallarchaeota archaeon]|nr:hypothetical protein [Candidatus Heimdallarchaeota archaeon]
MDHELKDLIFSLYPDPSLSDRKMNYSIQIVDRKNYYPPELEVIINIIRRSESPIERENAIDNFYEYINTKKKELSNTLNKLKSREKINLRPIYFLVNDRNEVLKDIQGQYIHVGGPLIGGNMVLGHELEKLVPEKVFSLLKFDSKNVCMELDHTTANVSGKHEQICNSVKICNNCELHLENLPLYLEGQFFKLIRATKFYTDQYEKLSTLNDFAPIMDSSLVASQAMLEANFSTFNPFPEILKQKLDQYNIPQTTLPDFLGIQKYAQVKNLKASLLGFSFISDGKKYALTSGDLFDGLKHVLIAESTLEALQSFVINTKRDAELRRSIIEYEDNITRIGRGNVNQFEGRLSESIRNKVGRKSMHRKLDNEQETLHRIPLGIFKFIQGPTGYRFLLTSFDETEMPIEYISSLDVFNSVAQLIINGSLAIFDYAVDVFSIHLQIGSLKFAVLIQPNSSVRELYEGMVLIEIQALDELEELFQVRGRKIPGWVDRFIDTFDLTQFFQQYDLIVSQMGELLSSTIRNVDLSEPDILQILENKFPLTAISKRILSDKIVPVLLRRILKEIEDFEATSGKEREYVQYKSYNPEVRSFGKENIATKASNEQAKLTHLEKEMNDYNEGLFEFLVNSIRRGDIPLDHEGESFYEKIRNVFEDIKIALVDFGLIPQQWVYASNLQIMDTYTSQQKWLRYSFESQLREVIEKELTDKDHKQLLDYHHSKHQVYNTFEGNIEGDFYVGMKKAFLYFNPKIKRFKEQIGSVHSISDLITSLEQLEQTRRAEIKVNLPKLPSFNRI